MKRRLKVVSNQRVLVINEHFEKFLVIIIEQFYSGFKNKIKSGFKELKKKKHIVNIK